MERFMTRKRDNPAYSSWYNMKDRCTNPNNNKFRIYGGKGISYTDKWKLFEGFLEDMGPRPTGTSLDRIDGNKGYYKENCRWADSYTQSTNIQRIYTGTVVNMSKYPTSHRRKKNYQASIWIRKIQYSKYFETNTEARNWLFTIIKEKV